ncbi:hypothetical protein [Sulfurisphaera ohwakuensis]
MLIIFISVKGLLEVRKTDICHKEFTSTNVTLDYVWKKHNTN